MPDLEDEEGEKEGKAEKVSEISEETGASTSKAAPPKIEEVS